MIFWGIILFLAGFITSGFILCLLNSAKMADKDNEIFELKRQKMREMNNIK
jgi:hypothetical protein